ncbi:hypothetical protein CF336_g4697 [Tilletia laevis]|nr:hypothetical protein CF336_g4697 [Tilletia laevis]
MLNNTALILLVLVLVLAVQASPVPRSPHTSSTEPGVDEPHDQAGVKSFSKALSDRTSKRNVTGPVGEYDQTGASIPLRVFPVGAEEIALFFDQIHL